jgi:hypothetical protein
MGCPENHTPTTGRELHATAAVVRDLPKVCFPSHKLIPLWRALLLARTYASGLISTRGQTKEARAAHFPSTNERELRCGALFGSALPPP